MRIFAEASDPSINIGLAQTMGEFFMQHFSGTPPLLLPFAPHSN